MSNDHTDRSTETPKTLHWTDQIEVAGSELLDRIKKLAAEGSVRRIRISEPDGDLVLEIPLTIGAIAGGAVVLAAPFLAVIGALAAFFTKVKIEVLRDAPQPKPEAKAQAAPPSADAPAPAVELAEP